MAAIGINRQTYDNYIFQIIKHGSLTQAARALGISQPALSQGINALEKGVGFKVFNRRTVPVSLTPEGELYYKYIRKQEVLWADFEKELAQQRQENECRVVIGAPAAYISSVVIPGIAKLQDRNLSISVRSASVGQLIELTEAGQLDCFISTINELPDNFGMELICREEIVLCVPEGSGIETLDRETLVRARFIFLEERMPLQQAVNRYFKEIGLVPDCRIRIDQVAEAISMVEQGLGVCFASKEAAAGRKLRTIPTGIVGRNIYLAYDKELFRSHACRLLMEAILGRSLQ